MNGNPTTNPTSEATACVLAMVRTCPPACSKADHMLVAIIHGTASPAMNSSRAYFWLVKVRYPTGRKETSSSNAPAQASPSPNFLAAATFRPRSASAAPATVLTTEVLTPNPAILTRLELKVLKTPISPMPAGPVSAAINFDRTKAVAKVTTWAPPMRALERSKRDKDIDVY